MVVFHGHYSQSDRRIFGLSEMFGLKTVEENDLLMFNYRGEGKFEILIFDNSLVEKYFDATAVVAGMLSMCLLYTFVFAVVILVA